MSIFAVIENNIVTNVIVADSKEIAEAATGNTCIESTLSNPAFIGYGWDGINFETAPSGQIDLPE